MVVGQDLLFTICQGNHLSCIVLTAVFIILAPCLLRLQLVVQGLPFAYTWKELKDLFAGVGDVDRADVMIGSDGRSKGWGVVRFTNAAAAQRGIGRWDKRELEGRTLAVFLDKFA